MNASTPSLDQPDGLASNLRRMVDETEAFLDTAVHSGDEKLMKFRARLATQVRHMRRQLDELEDNALYKARQAARVTDETIHSHPYGAIGIAAAVGVLIGFLATRR